jgi:ubiquinone/menaquinone biosynthesis C-methylase UbiE
MSDQWLEAGRRNWQTEAISWGIYDIEESVVGMLGDQASYRGKRVIELGCGTGYVSAWLMRLGAEPVGLDITPDQLRHAASLQREFGLHYPLVEASAEQLPFADESFDVAITEYGASIWCDPERWIPEAARVLKPGGELTFLRNSTLSMLCLTKTSTDEHLNLSFHEAAKYEDGESVEFHPPHGDLIRILRRSGFEILDLVEIVAPEGKPTRFDYVPIEWASRWPYEEVWRARKTK